MRRREGGGRDVWVDGGGLGAVCGYLGGEGEGGVGCVYWRSGGGEGTGGF